MITLGSVSIQHILAGIKFAAYDRSQISFIGCLIERICAKHIAVIRQCATRHSKVYARIEQRRFLALCYPRKSVQKRILAVQMQMHKRLVVFLFDVVVLCRFASRFFFRIYVGFFGVLTYWLQRLVPAADVRRQTVGKHVLDTVQQTSAQFFFFHRQSSSAIFNSLPKYLDKLVLLIPNI